MKKNILKGLMYLICGCAVLYLSTQPPVKGNAQPVFSQHEEVRQQEQKVDSLKRTLNKKANELKSLVREVKSEKPKIVYRYIKEKPKQITVYTRIGDEVTEHKVKDDNGFYILDLKHEPESEKIIEYYYIDTCIHERKKRTLWQRIRGK